jgi:hypothetical protein
MDWLQFEFDYRLDLPRLTPHILAVEAHRQAALTRASTAMARAFAGARLRPNPQTRNCICA